MISAAPLAQSVAPAPPDWTLIAQTGRGDRPAFEALYKQYYPLLFRFVYRMTRRLDLVEDVINEVMLVIWQKAANTKPLARASTWILGIAHNKALQAIRQGGGNTEVIDDERDQIMEFGWSDDGTGLNELETEDLFLRALDYLSPEQRAVLEFVYYHGLHYNEIADLMKIPENTVKTRVFHARRKLRAVWSTLAGTTLAIHD